MTINFMKQEFVPFIRAFAVIGFPMILLMLFFMKDLLMGFLICLYTRRLITT